MAAAYVRDTDRLGIGRPDHEPLASETVPEIVALIAELVASGHAYESSGDVYFGVRSVPRIRRALGPAAGRSARGRARRARRAQARPVDFALWKATKPGEDTAWPSPWGQGRPGWHIECSAMAEKLLGRAVRGARRRPRPDLPPPRERDRAVVRGRAARSRGCGRTTACCSISGEKMSKSQGRIDPLADALDRWGAETFLMFLLQAHYASPVEYDDEALERARAACATLRNRLRAGSGEDPGAARGGARRARRGLQHARGARAALPRAAGGARHGRRGARGARPGVARPRRAAAAPRWSPWRRSGSRRARAARLRRVRPAARRDRRRAAGRCATARPASSSTRTMADVVYGRRAVREALRGRRRGGAGVVRAGPRRDARLAAARCAHRRRRRASPSGRAAPTTRASWPRCRSTATPSRPSSSRASTRSWSRSTRSPTRTTWARSPAWPSAPGPTAS